MEAVEAVERYSMGGDIRGGNDVDFDFHYSEFGVEEVCKGKDYVYAGSTK